MKWLMLITVGTTGEQNKGLIEPFWNHDDSSPQHQELGRPDARRECKTNKRCQNRKLIKIYNPMQTRMASGNGNVVLTALFCAVCCKNACARCHNHRKRAHSKQYQMDAISECALPQCPIELAVSTTTIRALARHRDESN